MIEKTESTDALTLYCAVMALARTTEHQTLVIDRLTSLADRLTTSQPSILPTLMQMIPSVVTLIDAFKRPRAGEDAKRSAESTEGDFEGVQGDLVRALEEALRVAASVNEELEAHRLAVDASGTTTTNKAAA